MDNNFRKILFEGDEDPKLNILCDVLHEGLRSEFRDSYNRTKKNVIAIHCDTNSHIEYGEMIRIFSPLIPYGVIIYFLFSGIKGIEYGFDEIVYMEPYPFTLGEKIQAELDEISRYIKSNSKINFKLMFYRNKHQKSGAGDIVCIDQALKEAPDYINSSISDTSIINVIEYCVYRTPKDLVSIVHGGCGDLSSVMSSCVERFRCYSERIDRNNFCGEYGEYKDILEYRNFEKYSVLSQTESINKVTRFYRVKGSDDVWKQYVTNYISEYQHLLLDLVEEVYLAAVSDICFWDIEKDVNNLREGAKKIIKKSLMADKKKKEKCPEFEADYNEIIRNELELDTKFSEKVSNLINCELMEYLYTYLLRKEELLSKTFK